MNLRDATLITITTDQLALLRTLWHLSTQVDNNAAANPTCLPACLPACLPDCLPASQPDCLTATNLSSFLAPSLLGLPAKPYFAASSSQFLTCGSFFKEIFSLLIQNPTTIIVISYKFVHPGQNFGKEFNLSHSEICFRTNRLNIFNLVPMVTPTCHF